MEAHVTHETSRGFVFAETADHRNVFIHAKDVLESRVLHIDDRVEMDVIESARHPGKFEGRNVRYLGHTIARQVSEELHAKTMRVLGLDSEDGGRS